MSSSFKVGEDLRGLPSKMALTALVCTYTVEPCGIFKALLLKRKIALLDAGIGLSKESPQD